MQKIITFTLIGIFITLASQAQVVGYKYEKLYKIFIDQRYETCLFKAEDLVLKEKTKKDPEPYLWMSMCFYEISQLPEQEEFYVNALRYAFQMAAKCKKKDKEKLYYEQNMNYIKKLKKTGIEKAEAYYKNKKYRRASSTYNYVLKIGPDESIRYTRGVCDVLARNLSTGMLNIKLAMKNIRKGDKSDPLSNPLMINALITFSDYLYQQSVTADTSETKMYLDSANATILFAKEVFPGNSKINVQHTKLRQPVSKN